MLAAAHDRGCHGQLSRKTGNGSVGGQHDRSASSSPKKRVEEEKGISCSLVELSESTVFPPACLSNILWPPSGPCVDLKVPNIAEHETARRKEVVGKLPWLRRARARALLAALESKPPDFTHME